ncbi:hypothetical protein CARUB_v10002797mg [Capsella rubella]|uniref:Uncharacterized protein n=1 Tax=Capsella rubella TaxID=81985 RepID=R0FIJ9_9BRAS|nr:uncharacterized protein At5g23160 [Capsella rubella]EOA22212.1 hypothetical protein CARUB_v10002797mg [Capsella rubella]
MGKPEKKRASSSYVLRCFGVSRRIQTDKLTADPGQDKKKKTRTRFWFPRPTKFRLKEDEITLAPIYETSEKRNMIVKDDKQNLFRVIRHGTDRKNVATSGYKDVQHESNEKDTNLQRDINPDPLSPSGHDLCHERGKLDRIKTVGAGSKPKGLREKSSRGRKGSRVGKFDPVIGISIITLTLMIMLTWGRLCAILCTSTWCYFLPRLKEATTAAKCKRSGSCKAVPGDLDLNSDAYKKKVVLEGFLVRQYRV